MVQEREAKRAKLKSENASAYIQQDTSAGNAGQAKPITAVSHAKLVHPATASMSAGHQSACNTAKMPSHDLYSGAHGNVLATR